MVSLLIGAAIVSIGGEAVAWIFNQLTAKEEALHKDLKGKIAEAKKVFEGLNDDYEGDKEKAAKNTFTELIRIYKEAIGKFRKEKSSIKDDLNNLREIIESQLEKPQISPYVKSSLLFEKNRTDDANYRLEAYMVYLDWYENKLDELGENKQYENILDMDIPEALLPKDYLYIGKLVRIKQNEINVWNKYDQKLELKSNKVSEDIYSNNQEKSNFDFYKKSDSIPIFIDNVNKTNRFFNCSVAKAELWLSILSGETISAEVSQNEWSNSSYVDINYKGVLGRLPRENKAFPLKKYRMGNKLECKISENDFLLRRLTVNEKLESQTSASENREIHLVYNENHEKYLPKLESYFTSFDLFITEFVFEKGKKKIVFQINDICIKCDILTTKNYLKITSIKDEQQGASFSIDPPFEFNLVPKLEFRASVKEGLFDDIKQPFEGFLNFVSKEFQYKKHTENKGYNDFEFFRKWNEVVNSQIELNKYDEYPIEVVEYDILKTEVKGNISKILIEVKGKGLQKLIEEKSENSWQSVNDFIVSADCLIEGIHQENFNLGYIDDYNDDESTLHVRIENATPNIEILGKQIVIKVYSFQGALVRQRNALKNLNINKIVNNDLKKIIISPSLCESTPDNKWIPILENGFAFQNQDLTQNQKDTIIRALKEKDIFLIQGPPGTGKTTIIKELAYQYLNNFPTDRILLVSQQNVAVDNALSRIYKENKKRFDDEEFSFVRIAPDSSKVKDEDLQPFIIDEWFERYKLAIEKKHGTLLNEHPNLENACNEWWNMINREELKEVDNEILEVLINSHHIIGATCVGLANKNLGLDLAEFDIAIIDEAGRATPPELLIPMLRAKKVVLIGDHYQLPPQYDRRLLDLFESDNEEKIPTFEKEFLEKSFFEKLYEEFGDGNKSILTEQFRMPREVGNIVSQIFYDGKLNNGIEKDPTDFCNPYQTIQWEDVKGEQKQDVDETSRFNTREINFIISLLKEIDSKLTIKKTVAIITPYSAQKRKLLRIVNSTKKPLQFDNISELKIDTIDSFQGEEAQIVIYSTVRTRGNLSFLMDRKRLNVAMSRTQENLIFVGHKNFLRNAGVNGKRNLFREIIEKIS